MYGREFEDLCGWYFVVIRDAGCQISPFGMGSNIKSLFVYYEVIEIIFHYFKGLRPWAGSAGRSAGRAVSKHFEAPKLP